VTAFKLLEMQRHLMLMYTSCGWFFDELSGIETVQVMEYAGRAVQLGEDLTGQKLEAAFLERLAEAPSNVPEHGDGRRVYEKFVRPARVDLPKAAAHYAVSGLFENYPQEVRLFGYTAVASGLHRVEVGRARLWAGRARVTSEITQEWGEFGFAAVHFGDHNLVGGVRPRRDEASHERLLAELEEAFNRADFPAVITALHTHFEAGTYSLRSLFRDEQHKILGQLLKATAASVDGVYREVYEEHQLLMRFLLGLDAPLPKPFTQAAEYILNQDLRWAFADDMPDLARVRSLLAEVKLWRVPLDAAGLAYVIRTTLARMVERCAAEPDDVESLRLCSGFVEVVRELPFEVDFWKAQNAYYEMLEAEYPRRRVRARTGDAAARAWLAAFSGLGTRLNMRVPG
jgi:hypothetical protein